MVLHATHKGWYSLLPPLPTLPAPPSPRPLLSALFYAMAKRQRTPAKVRCVGSHVPKVATLATFVGPNGSTPAKSGKRAKKHASSAPIKTVKCPLANRMPTRTHSMPIQELKDIQGNPRRLGGKLRAGVLLCPECVHSPPCADKNGCYCIAGAGGAAHSVRCTEASRSQRMLLYLRRLAAAATARRTSPRSSRRVALRRRWPPGPRHGMRNRLAVPWVSRRTWRCMGRNALSSRGPRRRQWSGINSGSTTGSALVVACLRGRTRGRGRRGSRHWRLGWEYAPKGEGTGGRPGIGLSVFMRTCTPSACTFSRVSIARALTLKTSTFPQSAVDRGSEQGWSRRMHTYFTRAIRVLNHLYKRKRRNHYCTHFVPLLV